jgi:membrane dipeptidase
MHLLIDAHQDLAYNMMNFDRDYTLSAAEIRKGEIGTLIPGRNGDSLLGWPDYQRGQVAVIFATIFACPASHKVGDWDKTLYRTPLEANKIYRNQLDMYKRLVDEHPDQYQMIFTQAELDECLARWSEPAENNPENKSPVGIVLLIEGAEGILHPGELYEWWESGVRIIGPAWSKTRFCGGTRAPGPVTREGWELFEVMSDIGFGLDISHMSESSSIEVLDAYKGPLLASHANSRTVLKADDNDRHLSNLQIQRLIERQGIIGVIPHNAFLSSRWTNSSPRTTVTLAHVVEHMDHICQVAGNALHVGFGTDFDGGFGLQSVPAEIDTIADLQKVATGLTGMGYTDIEIDNIFANNWKCLLKRILPTT